MVLIWPSTIWKNLLTDQRLGRNARCYTTNGYAHRRVIIRPMNGTLSRRPFDPSFWLRSKPCWRWATDISACAGARKKVAPTLKTEHSSTDFIKAGQSICNVTDSKIIKLIVDDEPFWLPNARLLSYDRRLNMKAGTLDRNILWETPAGKQVSIRSRRLVSFENRHVAAIFYHVTLLHAKASVVISSEMTADERGSDIDNNDPRLAKAFSDRILHPRASYSKGRRIVLCHATERSRLTVAGAVDHALHTSCPHADKTVCSDDFGQVAFTIEALPDCPIQLTKYMVYHTSQTTSVEELCGRAEWTLDRITAQGFQPLLSGQEQYMDDFWRRSDVRVKDVREDRTKRSTVEIQQAIRFNLFHMLQASARAEDAGVPAKGLTGQAYEGHYFWDTEIYLLPFLTYTSPR